MLVALSAPAAAQTPRFTERDVSFRNGTVELHGTLLLPAADRPTPAVVFLHGSGPHARAGFRPYAEEFARLGLASLFFDKRGSGESGGSWITASLEDLAGDAVAAVEYLKTEEAVDPQDIGFWGVSQAGWVAPLAASRVDDIAFMILISGGGASPRESELFSYEHQFDQAGLALAEKARAREVLAAYFDFLGTGRNRSGLVARLDDIRSGPLNPLAEQLERVLPSDENRPNWSWVATHDPAPYIERLTIPVLLLFGERDTDHPTRLAIQRWRDALGKAGNDQVTLMVFPWAGHGIRMREATRSGPAPFAEGYSDVQLGWLWRHVGAGRR
jgi:hypothetical protein